MKAIRWQNLLPLVTILLLGFTVALTPCASAQTIRVLLVGNDSDVPNYTKSMNMVVGLLKTIAEKTGSELDSTRVDFALPSITSVPEQTTEWLENVSPARNDVVFVYYSRAEDDETMSDENVGLDIAEFAEKLGKKSGRLKILITDTHLQLVDNVDEITPTHEASESVFHNLFIEHKGFIHLSSNSEDEYAFSDTNGGWFTQALVEALHAVPENEGSAVSWGEVLEKTVERTKNLYEKHSPNFSDELKGDMNEHNIKLSQTPMVRGDSLIMIPTVHVLFIIEDVDDAGDKSVGKMNHRRIQGLLRGAKNLGICNVEMTSLVSSQDNLKPAEVKAWTEAIQPRENDTVFIYYSANDSNPDEANSQSELLKNLETAIKSDSVKKSRLQILIVDTYRVGPGLIIPRFGLPYPQTVFHNLFLEHKGLLHLVSRSEDELAFGDAYDGGWFTRNLVEAIYEIRPREDFPKQVPDPDRDFLGWKELVENTSKRTQDRFESSYPEGFEDAANYLETFPEEDREKLLEVLENENIVKRQTPKAHKLPKKM